tara:strand:+ start:233 stop:2038 length:1806 start_codon:yes stop_codon:yes gene_type:complete
LEKNSTRHNLPNTWTNTYKAKEEGIPMIQLGSTLGQVLDDASEIETGQKTNAYAVNGESDGDVKTVTDFHPYIKVTLDSGSGISKTTNWVDNSNGSPEWNETLLFDLQALPPTKKQIRASSTRKVKQVDSSQTTEGQTKTIQSSQLFATSAATEDIRIIFEAWHRDTGLSLDDHIGSGTLLMGKDRFNKEEKWTAKETIRLQNHRGLVCGNVFVILKWKRLPAKIHKLINGGEDNGAKNGGVSNNTAVDAVDVPAGILTVVVESGDHLIDPNKVVSLHISRSTRLLFISSAIVLGYFALGAIVYLSFEGPNSGIDKLILQPSVSNATGKVLFGSVVDSLYFSVCTFTTVGYGDIYPQQDGLKIFTVFYSLCGVAIVAVGVNVMFNACIHSTKECIAYLWCCKCGFSYLTKPIIQIPVTSAQVRKQVLGLCMKLFGVILVGTVAYMCPGMMQDGEPGLSFVDSLYMSTMTASSIGFGDFSPDSSRGRLFFVFWMVGGYVIVASSIREISQLYLLLKERQAEMRILNRTVGKEVLRLDDDGDGEVDKFEYLSHMVVVLGKMRRHEVVEIMNRFDELDVTGDGKISHADFASASSYKTEMGKIQ